MCIFFTKSNHGKNRTEKFWCLGDLVVAMGQSTLFFALISLMICSYCGKDFVVINRHMWRCKSRHSKKPRSTKNDNENSAENRQTVESEVTIPEIIICACGKRLSRDSYAP